MKEIVYLINILIIFLYFSGCSRTNDGPYSNFETLELAERDKIIWDLIYYKREFGKPEHKPICHDILKRVKYMPCFVVDSAFDLVEKQNWQDLKLIIVSIYKSPPTIHVYQKSFYCLRSLSGHHVPEDLMDAVSIIKQSGCDEFITDMQVSNAQKRLIDEPDEEAVLVYSFYIAGHPAGEIDSKRGRKCAVDILKTLNHKKVLAQIEIFQKSLFEKNAKFEIDWIAKSLAFNKNPLYSQQVSDHCKSILNLPIPDDIEVLETFDTHGGFHGDGEFYLVLQFNKRQISKFVDEVSKNNKWQKLPVSDLHNSIGRKFRGWEKRRYELPSKAKNGYYYFHDFQRDWYPNDPNVGKYSVNYVIAILDLDSDRLFVFQRDT